MRKIKSQSDFSYKMFLDATKDEEIKLKKGAKNFVEYLFDNRSINIDNELVKPKIKIVSRPIITGDIQRSPFD